jgi:metal-responsive CopG/Arc/MetJ family transcriptional regulator
LTAPKIWLKTVTVNIKYTAKHEMKKFTIMLTMDEWEKLNRAQEIVGFRTKSELIRFLIGNYVLEFYPEKKEINHDR